VHARDLADLAGKENEPVRLDDLAEWIAAGLDAGQVRDDLGHGSLLAAVDG
jgi:hypothetical protein